MRRPLSCSALRSIPDGLVIQGFAREGSRQTARLPRANRTLQNVHLAENCYTG
jgi:hypothetical protein